MYSKFQQHLKSQIQEIKDAGTYKNERVLVSPQYAKIKVNTGKEVLNFCANNYLGLANSPELVNAAIKTLEERAYGMASVRFICGTSDLHKQLEEKIAKFFGMEDAILYVACFD
ncbi:MAG: aminotransferase class I/II-fold pyridoxal phosphate-dependent enzyme, partial [Bacteroidales bacterium]|nr:aminotransferase class I/II-fold pyridoxal phosphate-dependent enzyme [Bacteroidales bacterium]